MANFLKNFERIAVAVGILLFFLVFIEMIDAYQTLRDFHSWAGYAFLALLASIIIYMIWQIRPFFSLPSVPKHPGFEVDSAMTGKQRKLMDRFLVEIALRFATNPILMQDQSLSLDKMNDQVSTLKMLPNNSDYPEKVEQFETEVFAPLIVALDQEAEKIVADNVAIVSVGTALSPYRSADVFIVLARNFKMINSILKVYRTRPSKRETVLVFYDIARVLAAVNILGSMDQMWLGISKHVPFIGASGEALSEGLFSGLLTSVAGHAAIDRARTYHGWSSEAAARAYRGKLNRWGKDILNILKRHGIDRLKRGLKPESSGSSEGGVNDESVDESATTGHEKGGFFSKFRRAGKSD